MSGRLNFAPPAGSDSAADTHFELGQADDVLKAHLRSSHSFHACAMTVAFLFFVPLGIFVARYCRHQPNISFLHGSLGSLTAELVLASATSALFTLSATPEMDVHRNVGIACACMVIATIVGAVAFSNMRRFAGAKATSWMRVRTLHEWSGWGVMALGWINIFLGLSFLWPEYLPIFYTVVIVVGEARGGGRGKGGGTASTPPPSS